MKVRGILQNVEKRERSSGGQGDWGYSGIRQAGAEWLLWLHPVILIVMASTSFFLIFFPSTRIVVSGLSDSSEIMFIFQIRERTRSKRKYIRERERETQT